MSAARHQTCPFCLRELPPNFEPLPRPLPCCGRFGCSECVRPLLESTGWTCLSCFKVSTKTYHDKSYRDAVRQRADQNGTNCPNSQIYLGLYALSCGTREGNDLAINWFLKAENSILHGSGGGIALPAPCQFKLGAAHESGSLRSRSIDSQKVALQWYQRAGEARYVPACLRLGEAYEFGEMAVKKSLNSASGWYGKAAEQGDAEGAYKLGKVFMKMQPPKYESSVRWWKAAVEQDHVPAMVALGKLYRLGLGVKSIDHREAVFLFTMASEWESAEGNYWLGRCYERGDGVPKTSIEQAIHYYKKAVLGHFEKATDELKRLGVISLDGSAIEYRERPDACARCGKHESQFDRVMIMCRRCHAVGYCSSECKQLHFREEHRSECGKVTPLDHEKSLPKGSDEIEANYSGGARNREPGVVRHSGIAKEMEERCSQGGEWEVFMDVNTGHSYYYNHYTGESQWEDPHNM